MDKIRRALARWLLGLAKAVHSNEVTPPWRPTFTPLERPEIIISDDVSWHEERISQLHTANRDLMNCWQRSERAYIMCFETLAALETKASKKKLAKLQERLRETFGAELH